MVTTPTHQPTQDLTRPGPKARRICSQCRHCDLRALCSKTAKVRTVGDGGDLHPTLSMLNHKTLHHPLSMLNHKMTTFILKLLPPLQSLQPPHLHLHTHLQFHGRCPVVVPRPSFMSPLQGLQPPHLHLHQRQHRPSSMSRLHLLSHLLHCRRSPALVSLLQALQPRYLQPHLQPCLLQRYQRRVAPFTPGARRQAANEATLLVVQLGQDISPTAWDAWVAIRNGAR